MEWYPRDSGNRLGVVIRLTLILTVVASVLLLRRAYVHPVAGPPPLPPPRDGVVPSAK